MKRWLSLLMALIMMLTVIPALSEETTVAEEDVQITEVTENAPAAEQQEVPEAPKAEKKEEPAAPKAEKQEAPAAPKPEKKEEPAAPAAEKQEEPEAPKAEQQEEPAAPTAGQQEEPEGPKAEQQEEPAAPAVGQQEEPEAPKAEQQEEPAAPAAEKQEAPEAPAAEQQEEPAAPAAGQQEEPEAPAAEQQEEPEAPAAEQQEDPEVPAAEQEDSAETLPAEGEATEETPAEPADNQPENTPAEENQEEPVFSRGYARIEKGVRLYTSKERWEILGTLKQDAVVFVKSRDEESGSLDLVMAVADEAVEAWVKETDVAPLTNAEILQQESRPADLDWQQTAKLANADFEYSEKFVPEETENTELLEGAEGEQPVAEAEAENAGLPESAEDEQPAADTEAADTGLTDQDAVSESAEDEGTEVDDDDAGLTEEEADAIVPELPEQLPEPQEEPATDITESENTESENTESENPEPENPEAENTDPDNTKPENTESENPEPEPENPEAVSKAPAALDGIYLSYLDRGSVDVYCYWYDYKVTEEPDWINVQRREIKGTKWTSWTDVDLVGMSFDYDSSDGISTLYGYDTEAKTGSVVQYRVQTGYSYYDLSSWKSSSALFTGRVSSLTAKENSKTRLWTLKWNAVTGASGYYIYRVPVDSNYNYGTVKLVKKITSASTTSWTDKSVKINKRYDYYAVPYKKVGTKIFFGEYTYVDWIYVDVVPLDGEPNINSITQVTSGVKLTWDAVGGATGYEIYCCKNPNASKPKWTKVGTAKATATSYTHKDKLTADKSGVYRQYRVYAMGTLNGKKQKGPSATSEIIFRMAPPKTVKVERVAKQEDTIKVTWSEVKGANWYYVEYRTPDVYGTSWSYQWASGTSSTIYGAPGTYKTQVRVTPVYYDGSTDHFGSYSASKSITPYWYYVLIAGEWDYSGNWYDYWSNDLVGPKYDTAGVKKTFETYNKADGVLALSNPNYSTIKNQISSYFGSRSEYSVCVFVYSGHGYTDGSGALAPVGDQRIYPSELKSWLDATPSRHKVLLLDSCGSGGMINKDDDFSPETFNSAFINAFRSDTSKTGDFRDYGGYTVITAANVYETSSDVGWGYWDYDYYYGYYFVPSKGYGVGLRNICRAGGYDYFSNSKTSKKKTVLQVYNYAAPRVRKEGDSNMQFYSSEPDLPLFR